MLGLLRLMHAAGSSSVYGEHRGAGDKDMIDGNASCHQAQIKRKCDAVILILHNTGMHALHVAASPCSGHKAS